jgi:flagellin-like protein
MNFEKVLRKNRKAISPVLATVILIAITLIAAIAVAGFVFGLFGSFTSTARISVTSATIPDTPVSTTAAPALYASNTGTSNAQVTAMTLTYGGVTCVPVVTATTITAGAGPTNIVFAAGTCLAGTSGGAYVGSLSLSNGGQVPFSGTFP